MKTHSDHSRNRLGTEAIDKWLAKYPNMASRTLARMIQNSEDGGLFTSHATIYNGIRYRRGTNGQKNRNKMAAAQGEPAPVVTQTLDNPFGLPASDETVYEPYKIEFTEETNVLVLSDCHVPYHSIPALNAAIKDGQEHKVGCVILNGDTCDAYQLSRFQKDPRKRNFKGEVEAVKQFLCSLRLAFPNAKIVWKDGNHDERLVKYLAERTQEIFAIAIERLSWPAILGFMDLGIDYVTDKRIIKLGKLTVMHGHEFPGGIATPVNAARTLYLRAKATALAGHLHQTGEHSEPNVNGEDVVCWASGCLCELHPAYMPINKWNHGHALVTVRPDGTFYVRNRRIRNGKIF